MKHILTREEIDDAVAIYVMNKNKIYGIHRKEVSYIIKDKNIEASVEILDL